MQQALMKIIGVSLVLINGDKEMQYFEKNKSKIRCFETKTEDILHPPLKDFF